MMSIDRFSDTLALTGRTLRHVTRSPDTVITTAVMPIGIMMMFVWVFGGAIDTGSVAYIDYMLPGILLITIASGVSYTGFRLFTDKSSGIFERFRSMPIARSGVLWAHVLTSLIATIVTLVIVTAVAFVMGFRTGAGIGAWLGVVALLVLFTLALTWLAVTPGLTASSMEGASAFAYPLLFLPFVSSAFVPTGGMPAAVRWFAEHQPVTSIVDVIRDLFAGRSPGTTLWVAVAWCLGLLVVGCVSATAVQRRQAG
jgi:ABC-2 type transport system permease protein